MNNLFNPALIIAVGFHVLLLAIPVSGGSNSAEPNPEESPAEQEGSTSESPSPSPTPTPTATPSSQLRTPALKSPTVARSPVPPSPKPSASPPGARTIARSTRPPVPPIKATSRASSTTTRRASSSSSRRASSKPKSDPPPSDPPARERRETPVIDPAPPVVPPLVTPPPPPPGIAIVPSPPLETDPFAKFPNYPSASEGSLRLSDRETYAFNTADELFKVIEFYESEVPDESFEALKFQAGGADYTIYEVKPKSGQSKYLYLIYHKGKTVILLLSEELPEPDEIGKYIRTLKEQAAQKLEDDKFPLPSPIERIRQNFRDDRFVNE
ncbi:MAG: hypothetical protein SW833_05310 [Cyanobacteriota bacterium]|nr:hypothetical protein [Cyanobacteriota bacterium]